MGMMKKNTIGVLVLLIAAVACADAGLPDPTRPADYSVARIVRQSVPKQRAEFNVNAIRISEVDRSAIVNGSLVRVGDYVGVAKVKEINNVEVVLVYERKLITLPLFSQGISKQFKTPEIKD